ncbi:MAG: RdgB/HAM1 family non-canonical purine NTP pyrophosphatase [Saprospiraceae bacterium]|nr:RdgB/HAM1 family non-canonical purine NTP pyrophosphatase [Saprospiraceae bacterium]
MSELVFASSNAHKVDEVRTILGLDKTQLLSLKDINWLEEIEETGSTLTENALIKSRTIADAKKINVFSDDSGLEVEALNMAPGVYTARYAGPQKDATDNMNKLLNALDGETNRKARFRAVVALVLDDEEHIFEGIVNGRIALEKKGNGGFGYDPIFIPDGYDKSFAELPESVKNKMSHRSRAVDKMRRFLESRNG